MGEANHSSSTHAMSSVEKLTIVLMKLSRTMTDRMVFQSMAFSPSKRQMDSSACFTGAGGLAMDRTSTRCCFLMLFTANKGTKVKGHSGGFTFLLPAKFTSGSLCIQHAVMNI